MNDRATALDPSPTPAAATALTAATDPLTQQPVPGSGGPPLTDGAAGWPPPGREPGPWPVGGAHLVRGRTVTLRRVQVHEAPDTTEVSVAVEEGRRLVGLATFRRLVPDRAPGTVAVFTDPDWPSDDVLDLLWRGLLEAGRGVLLPHRTVHRGDSVPLLPA